MNSLNASNILKKHPVLTAWATLLCAFIALKVIHQLPLQNTTEEYTQMLRDNGYDLDPLIKQYLKIDSFNTEVFGFWDDTIIVMDYTNNNTFAITCSSGFLQRGWIFSLHDKDICSLRMNPYTLGITGTVFGKTVPLTWFMVNLPLHVNKWLET